MIIHEFVWPEDRIEHIARQRKTPLPAMERPMTSPKLPQTDSIQELVTFWDAHDLTEFESELEEVSDPVFVRDTAFTVHLPSTDAETVRQMAKSKGVADEELIREWVLEKVHAT